MSKLVRIYYVRTGVPVTPKDVRMHNGWFQTETDELDAMITNLRNAKNQKGERAYAIFTSERLTDPLFPNTDPESLGLTIDDIIQQITSKVVRCGYYKNPLDLSLPRD